jgi:hypothetical protein
VLICEKKGIEEFSMIALEGKIYKLGIIKGKISRRS